MAVRISCGKPERNEVAALNRLASELPHDWALFTSIPRHLTGSGPKGREIDALALSPLGAVVIELKNFGGLITVLPPGEWVVTGKVLTDRQGNPQYPLQQAGKAAQVLKTALGTAAGKTYIEACAIASVESAKICFADPARPQPTMSLNDAVAGIQALACKSRGVSYPALEAFFALVGHRIPSNLDIIWREQTADQARIPAHPRGREPGKRARGTSRNYHRSKGTKESSLPSAALAIAVIVGVLVGYFLLKLLGAA
jgi:hypothetical protein